MTQQYEYRSCKKCGYILHQPTIIKKFFGFKGFKKVPGWLCLVCGRKSCDF